MRTSSTMTLLLLAALSACGGSDDSTGPADDQISISGTWSFQTGAVTVDGIACTTTGRTMTINQSGSTFTGQLTGGSVSCVSESASTTQDLTGFTDDIVKGVLNGASVSFDLDVLPGTSLTGVVSGNTMSGTIVEQSYTDSGVASGTGTWSASR
jgi:hypothetical protein